MTQHCSPLLLGPGSRIPCETEHVSLTHLLLARSPLSSLGTISGAIIFNWGVGGDFILEFLISFYVPILILFLFCDSCCLEASTSTSILQVC